MKVCSYCTTTLPSNARVCTRCGRVTEENKQRRKNMLQLHAGTFVPQMLLTLPGKYRWSPSTASTPIGTLLVASMLILLNVVFISFISGPVVPPIYTPKLLVSLLVPQINVSDGTTQSDSLQLDFGPRSAGQEATRQLFISNVGTQKLIWHIQTSDAHWMSVDQTAGTVQKQQPPQLVKVVVHTTNLGPGNYASLLQIDSNGGIKNVKVTMSITTPPSSPTVVTSTPAVPAATAILNVQPISLDFGNMVVGSNAEQSMKIFNIGKKQLQWQATIKDALWASLDRTSGPIEAGKEQDIKVTVDTSTLQHINTLYSATVTINSNGGQASLLINVTTISRPKAPLLCVSPSPLNFGTMYTSQKQTLSFTVTNCGGQPGMLILRT